MEDRTQKALAAPGRDFAAASAAGERQRGLVLESPVHWEAISSPTRFDILEQMRSAAPCSVAELARQMDRPADGLYHHLRILLDAGLIREVGHRSVGKQVEAVYDLSFDELSFEVDPHSGRNVVAMQKLDGALLRLCGRVFDAAIASRELVGGGPRQNAWGRVDTTWLTDEALAQLNAHLAAIRRLAIDGNRRREGQLITIGTFGGPALRPRRADGSKPGQDDDLDADVPAVKSAAKARAKPTRLHKIVSAGRARRDVSKRRI